LCEDIGGHSSGSGSGSGSGVGSSSGSGAGPDSSSGSSSGSESSETESGSDAGSRRPRDRGVALDSVVCHIGHLGKLIYLVKLSSTQCRMPNKPWGTKQVLIRGRNRARGRRRGLSRPMV